MEKTPLEVKLFRTVLSKRVHEAAIQRGLEMRDFVKEVSLAARTTKAMKLGFAEEPLR